MRAIYVSKQTLLMMAGLLSADLLSTVPASAYTRREPAKRNAARSLIAVQDSGVNLRSRDVIAAIADARSLCLGSFIDRTFSE